ncbi:MULTISPECIES: DUF2147 domain-containing protein [unclassified Aureimonas]|uniref:DUF2147 domain-containing protein n=1 Tax=unclassified Aureimonas TaxID=2615206 RepID=UPI000784CFF9|nr:MULTISPECIES: DUF2147 domain-containing protein [unclassified Aureimonas]
MKKTLPLLLLAAGLLFPALAQADPIEGRWKMPSGNDATIAPCSGGFCLTYVNGPFKGKQFGRMTPSGTGTYEGTVTDYTRNGREFTGKGKLSGDTLSVSGCVLGGLICRSQELKRV